MIKAVTGTKDILPGDIPKWRYIENLVRTTFEKFNYSEIRTPIFEETRLFARGIGEETDIVSKEMYTFEDRGGLSITLKPEMTAAVVRALIEHSLHKKSQLNKLFYISPMFRQERPQAGRLRQFHQFGAEAIGSNDPFLDAEMIVIAYSILNQIGLKNLTVIINTLGIPSERESYKNELKGYLKNHYSRLSNESKRRYETNILRIFDSKEEQDIEIMKDAPLLIDFLGAQSLEHFDKVKNALVKLGIKYEIEPRLVRGLDYYTHTTFEIASGSVGSQSALCGGGRYNGLVAQLGGDDLPGVGFAAGIERILLACENENILNIPQDKIDVYVALLDKNLNDDSFILTNRLRQKGLKAECDYLSRSLKAQMREANKLNASYVLFFGGEEYNDKKALLKNMTTGEQTAISFEDIDLVVDKIKRG
ncbi:histidine--tRNA ligase [Melioribacter sp. OK-6-Me]|uniref:histidine--tRNA ligase n=1 Tax=unclassified Melioribacter TaxID=2627329 RepID=UPI003EDA9138